ncbi:hypothetical protein AAH211_01320 [Serratia fonticola]|uniref:hypothetical protein n=1 Tax=Serratia fonticola TaxID=47917 RepID=UPI00398728E8
MTTLLEPCPFCGSELQRGADLSSPGFRSAYMAGILDLHQRTKAALGKCIDKGEILTDEKTVSLLDEAFKTTMQPIEKAIRAEVAHILDTDPPPPREYPQHQHTKPILDGLCLIAKNQQLHPKLKGQ